jgi:hypothetical protein
MPTLGFFAGIWLLAGASLVLALSLRLPRPSKALWVACLALAAHGTIAMPPRTARLALAVIVGWGLAESGGIEVAWAGLELAGLALWSYSIAGYPIGFSKIAAMGAYQAVGAGRPVWFIAAVVAVRHVAALGAAILPRLSRSSPKDLFADLPLLGALSAGSLFELWREKLSLLHAERLASEDAFVAQALWAAAVAWIIVMSRAVLAALAAVRSGSLGEQTAASSDPRLSPQPR